MPKLTKSLVDGLSIEKDEVIWDSAISGFGVRVKPTGAKSYLIQYRNSTGRSRRLTLGKHGAITVDRARKLAKIELGRVAAGEDPASERQKERGEKTVRELATRFMDEHAARRSESTRRNYQILWKRHVLPSLGARRVSEVAWEDIARLHAKMKDTPYMANRMLSMVGKAFSLAAKWGWRKRDQPNPGREHDRYPEDRQRGTALTAEQLGAVGKALEDEAGSPGLVVRVCMLCGARPSEIRELKWKDLDGRVINLAESKTGKRRIYLGHAASAVIARQPQVGAFVFPGGDPGKRKGRGRFNPDGPLHDLKGVWRRVKKRAGLGERIRLYDVCRHTFVTMAEELGVSQDRIKRLAGHSVSDITARYTHQRREVLLRDADRVASAISAMLEGGEVKAAEAS